MFDDDEGHLAELHEAEPESPSFFMFKRAFIVLSKRATSFLQRLGKLVTIRTKIAPKRRKGAIGAKWLWLHDSISANDITHLCGQFLDILISRLQAFSMLNINKSLCEVMLPEISLSTKVPSFGVLILIWV